MLRSVVCAIYLFSCAVLGAPFDHSSWDKILRDHVVLVNMGTASQVDYGKLKSNSVQLTEYLSSISQVSKKDYLTWPEAEKLAFLINAYNAFTFDLILTKYPNLKSIKDLGGLFSSPWKKKFIRLFDETTFLDYIEHEIIRKEFKEPRIHFAVNCASIGCPMLANEAFQAAKLNSQLENGIRSFLSDSTRNHYNKKSGFLEISKIFDWYKEDFEKGNLGFNSIKDVMAKYADVLTDDKAAQARIRNKTVEIKYLEYNWNLNKK
ncbi:MAG: DUF547 domain-containing protein [Pseudomonadota bacterium]|nr:DUF547 domain-containing protein [Pseudomonadota bacterium]